LGRARLPFRGAFSPPCTFSIFLMIDGAIASLPVRGSPYVAPLEPHLNGIFSQDSQGGVLKLSRVGLSGLWELISPGSDLRLE
jgi:hypothetical protein